MASNYTNPVNILDSNNATGLGSGGSFNVEGGASIKQDTFIGGSLSVSGTSTSFSDNILLINKNPSTSTDTGIIFQRYTSDIQNNDNYAGIIYSEQNDAFNLGYLVSDAHRNYVSMGNLVSLNTKDITTGNVNFTGNLYKNGTLYNPGSRWTFTNSDISYTSGNVMTTAFISTNISGSNLRLSGDLYVGGTLNATNIVSTDITSANLKVTGLGDIVNLTSTRATMNSLIVTGGLRATFNSNTLGSIVTTGGNVGVGIAAPIYKLDVQGSLRATNGDATLGTLRLTSYNIALGNNAGQSNQGSSSVAIGFQGRNTQGGNSVAVGVSCSCK